MSIFPQILKLGIHLPFLLPQYWLVKSLANKIESWRYFKRSSSHSTIVHGQLRMLENIFRWRERLTANRHSQALNCNKISLRSTPVNNRRQNSDTNNASAMGIKNFFKTKPPTQDDVESKMRENMLDRGLPVKHESKNKPNTFSAYGEYANDKAKAKKQYAPKGYGKDAEDNSSGQGENPYGGMGSSGGNPYGDLNSVSYGNDGGNAYSQPSSQSQGSSPNPYAQQGSTSGSSRSGNPYDAAAGLSDDPYAQPLKNAANPYATTNSSQRINHPRNQQTHKQREFSFEPDLNETGADQTEQQSYQQQKSYAGGLDLNDDHYADDDLNDDGYRQQDVYDLQQQEPETEEERLQREEDEEVEGIKGQLRFTKQESVASTRNTLRMAREAEESGKNTMGMLGAQSETLFHVERNLRLAETQDKMSKDKIAQLKHYNRNILKPNVQNPFTKNRRLREQEEKIKSDHIATKIENERTRAELSNSTQRIKGAIDEGDGLGDAIAAKYRREHTLEQAKQYQFEADSEDEEMEAEIGDNLDEISKFSGRLKKLALSQGEEIKRQNNRLRDIEDRADNLDVNVHVNTARLRGFK